MKPICLLEKITASIFIFLLISQNLFAYQADIENIPTDKYFDTALNEINEAESSIFLVMYLISITPNQPESQPSQLVKALINAKDRGVNVKVILDQNINFESESMDDAVLTNKNQQSYELLKKNNVTVFFDESQTFTHAKALVVDNKTVLLGSSNWSKSALTRNNETNVLIHSEDLAQEIVKNLNQIKLQENVPAILTPSIPVPKDFIFNKKLLGEMAASSDERVFDTYFYFLKEFDQNKEQTLNLDYATLAKSLNIKTMTPEDYRRQITKVLEKLETKYNLIDYDKPGRNQDTTIKLNDRTKDLNPVSIGLPNTYFKNQWSQRLSLPAKAMLLVYTYYSQNSPNMSFSISRQELSDNHNLSVSFISQGNQELRKQNLLDIKYDIIEDRQVKERNPNTYALKELYDPKEFEEKLKNLEQKHGQDKLQRAKQIAALVFEDKNLKTIYALMELEDQYGQTVVKQAADKIAEKSVDNPKRSAGYLINTIKSMAKEPQVQSQ